MLLRLCALALALAALLAFAACGTDVGSGTATVVVECVRDGETVQLSYSARLDDIADKSRGALSLIKHLNDSEESDFKCKTNDTGYGAYPISVLDTVPDTSYQYIAVYTSEPTDHAVPSEWTPVVPTVKYGDMTLTYSGLALNLMHVNDGTVILLRIENFS